MPALKDKPKLPSEIEIENHALLEALKRMVAMHEMMMEKVNHGASFYDGKTIQEINEAPVQARQIIKRVER